MDILKKYPNPLSGNLIHTTDWPQESSNSTEAIHNFRRRFCKRVLSGESERAYGFEYIRVVRYKTPCPQTYLILHGLKIMVVESFPQNNTCGGAVFEKCLRDSPENIALWFSFFKIKNLTKMKLKLTQVNSIHITSFPVNRDGGHYGNICCETNVKSQWSAGFGWKSMSFHNASREYVYPPKYLGKKILSIQTIHCNILNFNMISGLMLPV